MTFSKGFVIATVAATACVLSAGAFATPAAEPQRGRTGAARTDRTPAGPAFATPVGVAPQSEFDAALLVTQPFFDVSARIPIPYAEALPRVEALALRFPNDPKIPRTLAMLNERLGRFDEAAKAMEHFATVAGRSPNALRRLAAFYRNRARAVDEVRVLDELASRLPIQERGSVYLRAINAINDGRPQGVDVEAYYEKLIDASPDDGDALRAYVSLLLDSRDPVRAFRAVDRAAKAPGERSQAAARLILAERARIHDRLGERAAALAVYERAFDPLWPRAVASDYYALWTRYGMYRERRRALQSDVAKPGASLDTVSRLFNVYAYEGNLPAAGRLLAAFEAGRGSAEWSRPDLELVANLHIQTGDFDEASRYLYSLYLQGGMDAGAPDRERVLSRLFETLVQAGDGATRLAPGGVSLYADVARIDRRPGALNALLSVLLAGNNPAAEYRLEEARAGGYLNRALAHTIYERFQQEYPQSPRLGRMTVELLQALSELAAYADVVKLGTAFLAAHPESAEYALVALAVADAHVSLKNRAAERAILMQLLDRDATRVGAKALLNRHPGRFIPQFGTAAVFGEEEDDAETAPERFVAPNGTTIEAGGATRFRESDDSGQSDIDDFGGVRWSGDEYVSTPEDYRGRDVPEQQAPSYAVVLERMVASFEADAKKPEALAFFWSELRKHPKDEGLHERFLGWLSGTSLIGEQLKAYKLALERYDDGTWLHRAARWYIRQGRAAEMRRLTDQVIRTLDDEQVAGYLDEFAGYGATPRGDSLDVDKALALQMTKVALQRFPASARIASMLLDRLADAKSWPEWERLAREHYFSDPGIRSQYLRRLSETGRLEADYSVARQRASGGLEAGPTSSFAYAVFSADAARWLSHFDEATAAYRRLVTVYPGDPDYAVPLADLLRSFGSRDPKFYEESSEVLDALARVYPTQSTYATRSGEALAEAGRMAEAAKRWRSLVAVAPGSPAVRLDVATIFWDYYQFTDAAAEIEALRLATRDESLYAFRLGAIYDSKHDFAKAIPEYVRTLGAGADERNLARDRLAQLHQRPGMADRIAGAYAAMRSARPEDWQLVLGYADYLKWIERDGEAVDALNRGVAQINDASFLDEARTRFRSWRSPESEIRALRRLGEQARDERERIRARLQLAAEYEDQKRTDEAVSVVDGLVGEYSTNFGVLDEAVRFYWRVGRTDRSIAVSRDVIGRATGDYRKRFVMDLARRQSEAGRLSDAEATLRAYFTENALDMEVFAALARVLGDQKKDADLASLYAEGLKRIREAGLADEDETARVAALRNGMIATLARLGRYTEAIDQYIEIVNRDPETQSVLESAFDFASRHDQLPRLLGYYEKLAKDSYKDYRWSIVLGRLYDLTGNTGGAAEAYRRAVVNEPQRIDFRGGLADALVRAGRDEDAIVELRRAWEIDGKRPSWLVSVARIRARQGRLDEAAATIDEAIASRSTITPGEVCSYASMLASWGMVDKSVALFERGIDMARARPDQSGLTADRLGAYIAVAARVRQPADLFARLETLRTSMMGRGDPNSFYSGKDIARAVEQVEREQFARAVRDYGSAAERAALDTSIRTAASGVTTKDDKRRYLGIAQVCGLSGAHEAILVTLVDQALASYKVDNGAAFQSALVELTESLAARAQFSQAAGQLAAFRGKDPRAGDFDYDRRIAEYYRLAGDASNESAALERLYLAATGDVARGGDSGSAVVRLFELLMATGQRDRLVALAGRQSPHQISLINFLIARGDEALADQAIANAGLSPVWGKAKTAEVGLYFRNAGPQIESAFRDALRVRPIGELVGQPFDGDQMLAGSDYFLVARNYGLWLDVVANRGNESRNFIVGRLEQRPRDAGPQVQLARYYLVREDVARAAAHAELAGELEPKAPSVIGLRGEVLARSGRLDEAVALWTTLLEDPEAGSEHFSLYFAEMSSAGRTETALTRLRDVIGDRIYVGRFGDVVEVIGAMADFGRQHPESWAAISDMLYGAAVGSVDDVQLLNNILTDDLVPMERRGPFYRLMTDRLESLALGLENDPDASYIDIDGESVSPSEELRNWQRRAVNYYITAGSYREATALLTTIETAATESGATLYDANTGVDLTWVHLARATVALKQRDPAGALESLRRYCEVDTDGDGEPGSGDASRCQNAVAVLRANGAFAEADELLETTYRELLEHRRFDVSNFTGLAEVLYRRGRAEEANGVLRRLATRFPDSPGVLDAGADAAARAAQYGVAIELRELLARSSRADDANQLELARARLASGNAPTAMTGLLDIVADERASNTIRAQAIDLAVEAASAESASRASALARATSGTTEPERILAARLLAVGGDVDGARRGLLAVLGTETSTLAAIELGRLELAAGRPADAAVAFERSLATDASGELGAAIAFGGATPVDGLIQAYIGAGRLDAALKLAELRPSTYQGDDEDEDKSYVFEPDIVEARVANGLPSLSARNVEGLASSVRVSLAMLEDAAAKVERWSDAVAFGRRLVQVLPSDSEARAGAERRLGELLAASREAERKAAGTLRIGEAVASESIAIRDLTLD